MTITPTPRAHEPAPIDCETAVRRLWDYVDGVLPGVALEQVRAHLATCVLCAPRFEFARAMKDSLAALGAAEVSAEHDVESRRALTSRIREALRHAQTGGSSTSDDH